MELEEKKSKKKASQSKKKRKNRCLRGLKIELKEVKSKKKASQSKKREKFDAGCIKKENSMPGKLKSIYSFRNHQLISLKQVKI